MKKKKAELGYNLPSDWQTSKPSGWDIAGGMLNSVATGINSLFNPQQMRQLGNYLTPKFDMNSAEQLRQEELQKIPTAQNGYNIPDYYWLNQNYPPSVYQQIQNQPMGGQLPEVNVYGQAQPQMQYQPAQMQPLTYQPITPIQPLQSPPSVQPTLRPLETAQAQIPYSPLPQIEPLQQAPQIQGDIAVNNQNKGRGFKNPFEGVGLNVGSWITGLTSLASSLAQDNANQRRLRPYDPYVYNNQAYGTGSQSLYANGGTLYEKGTDKKYENWFKRNTREGQDNINPWDNNLDYNYYQYYQDMNQGITPFVDPNSEDHYPDTYKLPNHPSFSVESMYYINPQDQPNVLSYTGEFRNGGSINIPKENRGLFTEKSNNHNMSVQEFARYVLSHKEDFPLKTERQAQFAQNSTKWNRAEDGKTVSKNKAKEILRDGTANKKPLTDKQKRYFGWIAGGKKEFGGEIPQFQIGQEVDLTDDQIQYLINQGYEFE